MNLFKQSIIDSLKIYVKISESDLEVPPDPSLGDYALPCFSFAKELKKSPMEIAIDLAMKIKEIKYIEKVKSTGPYLNFFIKKESLSKHTLSQIHLNPNDYGKGDLKKTIMVEYSSPNTNKPLHLGHLRNILIGRTVSNIFSFQGNKVIQSCLVNDRGIHIMKSMLAYEKWGDGEPDKKTDHFVGDYYVLYNDKLKKHPEIETEAQEMLVKWENGDKAIIKQWEKMNKWAEDGFNETYKSLGIKFDKYYYESNMYDKGKDIVMKGFNAKIFEKDEGAIIAKLEKYNLSDKVLVRGDGTTLYMTQDIFLGIKKFEDYKLDKSVYVVGSEQILHFKQLFKILELLGNKQVKDCFHLAYGMVYLPDGRMKSREGTVVDADNIISDMKTLAAKEIKKRHKELSEKEVEKRSYVIGLSALKFFMLKTDAQKDMTFNPKESISFEGETGPYVQYAYARIASIIRKYAKKVESKVDFTLFGEDEKALIKFLFNYSEIIVESSKYKPSVICRYLLDLAQYFNEYYHKTSILKADDKELIKARILLIYCVKEVIKSGLNLLDVEVLEEM